MKRCRQVSHRCISKSVDEGIDEMVRFERTKNNHPAKEEDRNVPDGNKSIIDSPYSKGIYFSDPHRHSEDSQFKAKCFLQVFVPLAKKRGWEISSYVDVGCGSGQLVRLVADGLKDAGFGIAAVKGYDVSPHVSELRAESVEYVHGDFCSTNEQVDLVTLFDVLEHVACPVEFLKSVASRASMIGLNIPLDNTLNNALRDKFRYLLDQPGHLLFLDAVNALNLCSLAGLRVVAYEYAFGFRAPSGHRSLLAKVAFPARMLLSKISPWLLSKTIGGASLLVIARTPENAQRLNAVNCT